MISKQAGRRRDDACFGSRPVANAFGAGSLMTYTFGIGVPVGDAQVLDEPVVAAGGRPAVTSTAPAQRERLAVGEEVLEDRVAGRERRRMNAVDPPVVADEPAGEQTDRRR